MLTAISASWRAIRTLAATFCRAAAILLPLAVLLAFTGQAQAQLLPVPPGNRNATQPPIPSGSVSRTRATHGSFQGKYEKIRDLIARDRTLQAKIRTAAALYGIHPVHIVGGLVGEHTYNVDALDHLQTYLVKAASYLGSAISFRYDGESVSQFVQRPEFVQCFGLADSYDLWNCREDVWDEQFRGKSSGGKSWPNERFGRVFFQPLYAGQTFGLGQINPLTALAVNDLAVRVGRLPPLDPDRAPEVYAAIMDPDKALHYMAAVIRVAIDAYAAIAGVDISTNPGIVATLYNLGDVRRRAREFSERRAMNVTALPQENYYGWLVNDKLAELLPLVTP